MDARLDMLMYDIKKNDKSFQEKETFLSLLFGGHAFTQNEMRDTWFMGIRRGLEIGLNKASLEGQKIEIRNNIVNDRHKEFYNEFLKLSERHKCQIQYHPSHGMCVVDLKQD